MTWDIFAASLSLASAIFCTAVAVHIGYQYPWRGAVLILLGLVNVWFFVKDVMAA